MKYILLKIVIYFAFTIPVTAQQYFGSYVHLDAGVNIALSDVKRYDYAPGTNVVSEIQPGTGLEITYFTSDNIGLNLDFHFYSIAGFKPDWNLKYTGSATLTSFNLSFSFNEIFENQLRSPWDRRFKAFAKLGYGRFVSNSSLELIDEQGVAEWNASEIYFNKRKNSTGAIPLEVNVMYKLTKRHNRFFREAKDRLFLVFSGSIVFLNTDLMDNYVDQEFSNDALTYYSVGIAYFFGK